MAGELGVILDYVNKLDAVEVTGVKPLAQVTGLENIFRADDHPLPAGELTDKLVSQFPNHKENHLKVKPVFAAEEAKL